MHSTSRKTRLLTSVKVRKHLAPLLALALLAPLPLAAQAASILTGKVTDRQNGQPLAGAHVSIMGTTQGTISRSDGTYRLPVPAGRHMIYITYLGYAPHRDTVDVPGDQSLNRDYTLDRGVAELNAAVVIGTR